MKAFAAALISALILLIPIFSGETARAETTVVSPSSYAYADIGSESYFCKDKDEKSALFIIPQTYCVEILGEEDGWYKVRYARDSGAFKALYGYCRQEDLVPCDGPLENEFLNMTVTVTYTTDPATSGLPSLGKLEFTAAYYGAFRVGKTTCSYVLCGEYFGYIAGSIDKYPLNELPVKDTFNPANEPTSSDNTTLIVAIVVTVIAAAVIVALYLTGKNGKRNVQSP